MFCPNCGKADQETKTYCRSCGEFLPDLKNVGKKRQTPAEQFQMSIIFDVLSATAAISMATALFVFHAGMTNVSPLIWSAISLFYVIGIWQIVSFVNNLKLRKRFIRKKKFEEEPETETTGKLYERPGVGKALPDANLDDMMPASVTENTTSKLGVKIKRSTEPEKEPD